MTREEAKLYIIRHCNPDYPKGKTEWERAVNMAIKALEQSEIIRCKECKYYRQYDDQDDLCVYTMTSVEADDYCSYAERREDAERKNNV